MNKKIFVVLFLSAIFFLPFFSAHADTEIKKPTASTDPGGATTTNPANSFDTTTAGDTTTFSTTVYGQGGTKISLYHSFTTAGQIYSALSLKLKYSAQAGTNDTYRVQYSTSGLSACTDYGSRTWTDILPASFSAATLATATATLSAGQDLTQLCLKYVSTKTGPADAKNFDIYDIWTEGTYTPADVTPPTVTNVTSSLANGSYTIGQGILIDITFSEVVNVVTSGGTPSLTLNSSGSASASYSSGTGSATLTFLYTVSSGDTSADLDYSASGALSLNGGTIKDAALNNATLTLASPGASGSLGFNKAIVIDTTAPSAPGTPDMTAGTDSGTSSTDNITSDTTPDFTISCETGSTVTLYDGITSKGSGTCSSSTITITSSALAEGAHASINAKQTDTAGNISVGSLNLLVTIDTTVPTVSNVTSSLADGSYVNTSAQVVPVQVVFSESVTVTGTPQITLSTGSPSTTVVDYSSGSPSTTLTFNYTVANNNYSADLDYASTSSLALNSGTIKDTAGNNATLTLASPGTAGSLGANKAIVITHPIPTLSSLDHDSFGRTTNCGGMCTITDNITLTGTNFDNSSVVKLNGTNILTFFSSSTELSAEIPASTLLTSGIYAITVFNPTPGGGTSGSLNYTVIPFAPGTPDMTAGTDSGSSSTDNITSDTTPDFTISCETGATVTLYDNVTSKGTGTCVSETVTITSSALAEGAHASINAKQTDSQGNVSNTSSASSNLSITIDVTNPTSSITSPSDNSTSTSTTVNLSGTSSDTNLSTTTISIDSGLFIATSGTAASWTHSATGLSQGAHTFQTKATDTAGNTGLSSIVDVTVDSIVPTLTTRSIASDNADNSRAKVGDTVTLSFTSSETIQTPSTTFFSGGNPVAGLISTNNPSGNNWEVSYTTDSSDTEGVVTFTIDFQDIVGNNGTQVTTTTNSSSVTFDKTSPVLAEVTPVPTPTTDDTPSYAFSSTEAGNITYGGDCDSATTSATVGSNTITFNSLSNGAHTNCTIEVTDATGNTSDTLNVSDFTVNNELDHFTIDTISSPQIAGTAFDIVITAKTSDNQTLTTFTGTVDLFTTAGSITPTVSGSFIAGVKTQSVTITQSGTGKTITVQKTGSTEAGISNTFDVNPGALDHFNINTISSPQAEAVAFDVTMTAKDANNNTVVSFTGTANLSTNSGSVSPTVSSTFTSGVRTESVTLTGSGAGRTITVTKPITLEAGTSNTFTVTPAPTKFVIINPTDDTVGNNVTVTVEARDAFDAVVTSYQYDVTLEVDGDATIIGGNPVVDITNGIGTIQITDETAETVNLTLTDTESTGLNVDSTQNVVFSPGPLHHFTFDNVTTPQGAGALFDLIIYAKDSFENDVPSFTGTVDLTTNAGIISPITSGSFTGGTITQSVSVTESGAGKTITATKTGDTETGTSNSFTVSSDVTTDYFLNDPGDMTVDTRVGYTVTRKDQFANLATIGTETVYLYSTSANGLFYNAAIDGNEITEIDIANNSSSANFWYYDDLAGSYNITVSDSPGDPDGNDGVNDDSDSITVNIAPIVATKFIIEDPIDDTVADIVAVTVKAVDNANNVDTTYMNDVTLNVSGSATGGGIVVDIINGVGSINITDTVAETVNLSLSDTQGTLLDVTSTQDLSFAPGPIDYFEITPFLSPQIAGETFDLVMTAKDQYGNTATSFTGTVDLDVATGSISPTVTASFIAGVRTESVYVTTAGTGNTITVTRTGGSETDTSDSFDVEPGTLDNFLVEGAGGGNISTQTAGVPFDIQLTARDAYNNILNTGANNYNSTASITSTGTLTAGSGTTASFTNGVLATHSITISDAGLFTITAEDGSASGTSNSFTISVAPIVATKFIILDPDNATVGGTITVTVKAVDNANNVDSTYQNDVTLNITGSATGGGLVNIVNGVGTIDISNTVAQTITLSLSDTELTGLNVTSTQDAIFSAVVIESEGGRRPAVSQSISSSGRTIPTGRVTLFALTGGGVPLKQSLASSNGSYSLNTDSIIPGVQFYGLLVTDRDGLLSQARIYQINSNDPSLSLENFIASPTIGLLDSTVSQGDFLNISGYVNSGAIVQFEIDGTIIEERVITDESGSYKLRYNTAGLSIGEHSIRTRQILEDGRQSEFSISKTFKVSSLIMTASDFNNDGQVDVRDASVFLSNWLNPESDQAKAKIDFNNDGKVDIQDFSIFVNSLKL